MQNNNKSNLLNFFFLICIVIITIPILILIGKVYAPCKPYIEPLEKKICYVFPICEKNILYFPEQKVVPYDTYNVIIDIKTLQSIKEGWNITLDGSKFSFEFIDINTPYKKTLVGMAGDYDKGKTFVMNQLVDKNFTSTFSNCTPAFAFYESIHQPDYVFMDTMGVGRLSSSSLNADQNSHSLRNIKAIDHFIEASYGIAQIVIYVTDSGKNTDICTIRHRLKQLEELHIIVVVIHNLKEYEEIEPVEYHISSDILNPEIGGIEKVSKKGCRYWSVDNSYHLVMAKEGTRAGDVFNQCTIDFIKSNILVDTVKDKPINILNEIIQITEKNLPSFLKDPNISPDSFVRTKKDNTKGVFANFFNNIIYGKEKEEPQIFMNNEHNWEVIIQNNVIKLKNDTFPIEFAYSDCCGFSNIGFKNQIDVIVPEGIFGIAIDAPNSNVIWFCRNNTFTSKAYVFIERILPSYTKLDIKPSIDSRTYSTNILSFDIPSASFIDCGKLVMSHVYKNGTSYVHATNGIKDNHLSKNNKIFIKKV